MQPCCTAGFQSRGGTAPFVCLQCRGAGVPVSQQDPSCAIAHWGSAMTHFHQLWDVPPSPADTGAAKQEIGKAASLAASERERGFIRALNLVFKDAETVPYRTRAENFEAAMHDLAAANPTDIETQVFYALALISNASP